MKKILSVIVVMFVMCVCGFAQSTQEYISLNNGNNSSSVSKNTNGSFFDALPDFIGSSLTVYVSDIDTVIRCKLVSVYNDGIIVKTNFNQTLFISKKSISYIEIKNANESDF